MKAWDIMTAGAVTVSEDMKLEIAAQLMIGHRISGLPVINEQGKLTGMLTEGDLLHRKEVGTEKHRPRWIEFFIDPTELAKQYVHERGRKVSDVMSRKVVSLPASATLEEIVFAMEKHRVKRIPIVHDSKGRVVGIVSRANIVRAMQRRMSQVSQPLKGDLAIRKQILEELQKTDWAPFGTIDIRVQDGIVDLDGTVTDRSISDAIRVAAENTAGVKDVRDNARVVSMPAGYL